MLFIGNIAGKNGGVDSFCMASVKAAKEMGLRYYLAANFSQTPAEKIQEDETKYDVSICQIDFARNPLNLKNIRAYKQLVKLIQAEKIDYIHCNTPTGGLLGRLAGKRCKVKKIIYQAHGFHFCKGTPLVNWLIYYPVERILSHWTDVLITINEEDYEFAKKHMHAKKVDYVPGVGIDLKQFSESIMDKAEKDEKRLSLGLKENDVVFTSVGELNKYKNHILMIKALQKLKNDNYKYIICGAGELKDKFNKIIRDSHLTDNVKLLGYRTDISEILQITDVFVFPSTFEGLPRALMEAIASKVMVICSASRGNTDLVKDKRCLFDYRSVDELIQAIHNVENMTEDERNAIIEDNYSRLLPREKSVVIERMKEIYKETEAM